MGVVAGDYDGDGYQDLYVTQYEHSILYHNNGDGTFTDVTAKAGVAAPGWGTSAVWFDYDNDGRMDLFVSNDTVANFLFVNRGHGKFEENGLLAGVGYSAYGRARSGMGVDAADFDQDGWIDLFVANIDHEMYSLYHNNKDGTFTDLAPQDGIGSATDLMSGWGLKFFDCNNDGNLDLFLCNGHPDDKISTHVAGITYREPLLLFQNTSSGFQNVSDRSGPIFDKLLSGRGMALGDFNNDGLVDVLITQNGGPPIPLKNVSSRQNHWVGLRLIGKKANIDAIGAKISY